MPGKRGKDQMLRIFISYSRIQTALRERFEKFIKFRGYEPVFDKKDLQSENWEDELRELLKSCDVMLLLWSEDANESPFVTTEIDIAIEKKIRVLPIFLDTIEVPPDLKNNQGIRYDKTTEAQVVRELNRMLINVYREKEKYGEVTGNPLTSEFTKIPGGSFQFSKNNKRVEVDAFELTDFLITNFQFKQCFLKRSYFEYSYSDELPVNNVSWNEAINYCRWLSDLTGWKIKLPSELEWEYAAKGGKDLEYATDNGEINSGLVNYGGFEGTTTTKGDRPNPFEIYDMSGNLWEWCNDVDDKFEEYRVVKGGSLFDTAENCRCSSRYCFHPKCANLLTGFRVMRVLT